MLHTHIGSIAFIYCIFSKINAIQPEKTQAFWEFVVVYFLFVEFRIATSCWCNNWNTEMQFFVFERMNGCDELVDS